MATKTAPLYRLPPTTAPAVAQMATDHLLLTAFTPAAALRWRAYAWGEPAATFGYAQAWEWARDRLPATDMALVRRETGGGFVDHRHDWTYSFVIPREHPAWRLDARVLYARIHEAIAQALRDHGQPCTLTTEIPAARGAAAVTEAVCFATPALADVIAPDGRKIAGAAMRRGRDGLLLQGTLAQPHAPALTAWEGFADTLGARFAVAFGVGEEVMTNAPAWAPEALQAARDRFASQAWNERR